MKKFVDKKKINFLTIFLILDLLTIFTIFKTSNATYTSQAIGTSEMEVALYAFRYEGVSEVDGIDGGTVTENVDINLGNISPGETKYYKFDIYNYLMDENNTEKLSETSISYDLKIITTTNLPLEYSLYVNQNANSSNATDLFESITNNVVTDGFGTYYKVFPVSPKCFKLGEDLKYDKYTLVVEFPEEYSGISYQDIIESIKIQIESKQVLPGDAVLASEGICR